MRLYRYMSFQYLKDTVLGAGFVAQHPSCFDDVFEGVVGVSMNGVRLPVELSSSAFDQWYSILCFNKPAETSSDSEMLMWSLYAEKHEGIRVVIDLPWSHFSVGQFYFSDHVQYDEKKNELAVLSGSMSKMLLSGDGFAEPSNIDFLKTLYFTKSPCWSWEAEYRMVVLNEEVKGWMGNVKGDRYAVEFLKQFVVGVDFGIRLWQNRSDEVLKLVEEIRDVRPLIEFRRPILDRDVKSFSFVPIA